MYIYIYYQGGGTLQTVYSCTHKFWIVRNIAVVINVFCKMYYSIRRYLQQRMSYSRWWFTVIFRINYVFFSPVLFWLASIFTLLCFKGWLLRMIFPCTVRHKSSCSCLNCVCAQLYSASTFIVIFTYLQTHVHCSILQMKARTWVEPLTLTPLLYVCFAT